MTADLYLHVTLYTTCRDRGLSPTSVKHGAAKAQSLGSLGDCEKHLGFVVGSRTVLHAFIVGSLSPQMTAGIRGRPAEVRTVSSRLQSHPSRSSVRMGIQLHSIESDAPGDG